jgi:hypothetical protein
MTATITTPSKPRATPAKAQRVDVLSELEALEEQRRRVQRRRQELEDEITVIAGPRQNGRREGGKLARARVQVSDAKAAAVRDGVEADVGDLLAEIGLLEIQLADLERDRASLGKNVTDRIDAERRQLLVEHHRELLELARAAKAEGDTRLSVLRAAAADICEQRAEIDRLLRLAAVGADDADRELLVAEFAPWAATRAATRLWEAVDQLRQA